MKFIHSLLNYLLLLIAFSNLAHAFYDPGQGRWVSRDPIGQQGGHNLYGILSNDAVNAIDSLGLLKVENKLQKPEEVPVTWADDGDFESPTFLGITSEKTGKVTCECSCPKKKFTATCEVSSSYAIKLKRSAFSTRTKDYWRGVYGHELAHVKSRNSLIAGNVINFLSREEDEFNTDDKCQEAIKGTDGNGGYTKKYQDTLDRAMTGENHKGGGSSNADSPGEGELITPPNDPPWPQ